jgi:hypothetical protein
MGTILFMIGEQPLLDCIRREVDANFAAGIGSWLGCKIELEPHSARFYT